MAKRHQSMIRIGCGLPTGWSFRIKALSGGDRQSMEPRRSAERCGSTTTSIQRIGNKMIDLSIEATTLTQAGTTHWRTEFERIYVLAARKRQPTAQSEHCINVCPKQSPGE